jgi:hypothetical protein
MIIMLAALLGWGLVLLIIPIFSGRLGSVLDGTSDE